MDEEFELHLSDELRKRVEAEIIRKVNAAVADSSERDENFRQMYDQNMGRTSSNVTEPWRNASDVDHPLTQNITRTVKAVLVEATQHDPKVMIEAVDPDGEEAAESGEAYMSHKMYEGGIDAALKGVAHNATQYPVAIMHVGYEERVRQVEEPVFFQDGSNLPHYEEDKEDDEEYEQRTSTRPAVEYKGLKLECIDTPDFYKYPATATSIESAEGVGPRDRWSAHDLINSIEDMGIDEEIIEKLLRRGPTHAADDTPLERRKDIETDNGVQPPENERDGFWHIFTWYSKFPLLYSNGRCDTPKEYRQANILTIVCPDAKIVLRMTKSDLGSIRPFAPFYTDKLPSQFYGDCIPDQVDSLQANATAEMRYTANCLQIAQSPNFKVKDNNTRKWSGYRFGPGKLWPVQNMDEIQALPMPELSRDGLAYVNMLSQLGQDFVIGGTPQLQGKVRKKAELEAQQQAMGSKFNLILSNFLMGLEETWRIGAAILALKLDDNGDVFLDEEDHEKTITPQMLKRRFLFKATSSSANASQEQRLRNAEALFELQDKALPIILNEQLPIKMRQMKWHAAREIARNLGVFNFKAWFGDEPKQEQQIPQAPQPLQLGAPPPGVQNGNGIRAAQPVPALG